jgi:hypothetical protein
LTDDINELARYRDRVLDETWKLVDDRERDLLRRYITGGWSAGEVLAEAVPIKLRRAQERLLEAIDGYEEGTNGRL